MAELVDALVSGTSDESRGGSSPLQGTTPPVRYADWVRNQLLSETQKEPLIPKRKKNKNRNNFA